MPRPRRTDISHSSGQKKCHPRIVENAKNSRQIAIKIEPKFPKLCMNAACVSAVPSLPELIASHPLSGTANTVRFKNNKCINKDTDHRTKPPDDAGFLLSHVREHAVWNPYLPHWRKSPLATPKRIASRTVIPAPAPITAFGSNAPLMIIINAVGT